MIGYLILAVSIIGISLWLSVRSLRRERLLPDSDKRAPVADDDPKKSGFWGEIVLPVSSNQGMSSSYLPQSQGRPQGRRGVHRVGHVPSDR